MPMPTRSATSKRYPAWVTALSSLPSRVVLAVMCACNEPSTHCAEPIQVSFKRCEGLCNARLPSITPGETLTFEPRCLPPVDSCTTTNICGTSTLDIEYTAVDDGGPIRVVDASLSEGLTVMAVAEGWGKVTLFDSDGNSLGADYLDAITPP